MATTIPPITDPAGDYWEQPKPEDIKFVLGHAWVNRADFNKLKNYTATNPTGAYIGKMWKRQTNTGWWLMWVW